MTFSDSTIRVDVDPCNPGEYFACCGLLELANRLWDGAEGWFHDSTFFLSPIEGDRGGPLADLLLVLAECRVEADNKPSAKLVVETEQTEAGGAALDGEPANPDDVEDADHTPSAEQKTDKIAPLRIVSDSGDIDLRLDWWTTRRFEKKRLVETGTAFKTWAANATSEQMYVKWVEPVRLQLHEIAADPGTVFRPAFRIQGSYGFDSRAGWDALEVGFSLNEHTSMKAVLVSPALELLCAVGLKRFLPPVEGGRESITYATWDVPLLPTAARPASAGIPSIVVRRRYRSRFTARGSFRGLDYSTVVLGDTHE